MATAKERWGKLNGKRDAILQRARDCADITIPSLMPPEGHTENSRLTTPYQSLGARGLNNLASKLALALLPAGNPFFRFRVGEDVAAEVDGLNEIEEQLRKLENRAMKRVENGNLRVIIHATLKQLAGCGNALLHMPDEGGSRMFRLPQYCVLRDPMGVWQEVVLREMVTPSTLEDEVLASVGLERKDDDDDIEVFTHIKREGKKVVWFQEMNDVKVPGTDGRTRAEDSPWIPLRWSAIENENYGRGHVEEYLGDLRSLESLSKSIVTFAAAAAKVIFLERPNSSTDIEALEEAESGEFVEGNIEDIAALTVEKFHDFQVAKATADDLTLRLSHGFLLSTGTVRDAERVTAEEIRMQAQELEDVLGGVYTVLAQELQLPIVRRLMAQLRKAGEFPTLPSNALEPVIVTGFDALGRGHELNKMRAYFADGAALFGEAFMAEFSVARVAAVMATNVNVDIEGIKKTKEEKEQDRQDMMQSSLIDKAAGPVAGAVAGAIGQQ